MQTLEPILAEHPLLKDLNLNIYNSLPVVPLMFILTLEHTYSMKEKRHRNSISFVRAKWRSKYLLHSMDQSLLKQ